MFFYSKLFILYLLFYLAKINVNFLGEWYAVMIDWNAPYEYKQQQVIQQVSQVLFNILTVLISFSSLSMTYSFQN